MSYLDLTIKEIHEALKEGKVTPVQLTEEAIERVKTDECNAFEALDFEGALKAAKELVFDPNELLSGIPFLAKDNFSTKGIETTASSNILNGYVPLYDAEVIKRLKDHGAILIGKTTLDELAMGGTGTTGHKGVTTNPYDHERLIGGSSCGSCAAVAAGVVPFALGSDTGDSVRKPASLGGLVGFKPTWGRVSRYGLFPFATSMDAIGWFTRSVYDSAYLTKILSGHDNKDMSSSYEEVKDYVSEISKDTNSKTIGYFKKLVNGIKDQNIVNKYYEILDALKAQGYKIENYDFPEELLNALYPTYMVISCSEATSNNANLDGIRFGPTCKDNVEDYRQFINHCRTAGFSDLIKRRFVIGSFSLLSENQEELFRRAQKARRLIVEELKKFFEKCDYLVLPAAQSIAGFIKDVQTKWTDKPDYIDNHLGLANLAGLPSLTIPMGLENGLPYGINITCKAFDESNTLNLGQKIEDITGLKNLSVNNKEGK